MTNIGCVQGVWEKNRWEDAVGVS